MASGPIRDPETDDLLTPQNSALVIIDYQPLQVNSIGSMDRNLLVNHIVAVAKTGVAYRLPTPPTPFGSYVEAVQTGRLLYLSGMLPVVDHKPAYVGTLGLELDTNSGQDAARIAALGALAAARNYLGTLDRIKRVVRLGVFIVTSGNAVDQPTVANGASDLLRDVLGEENMAVRSVIGVDSLPLGVPIELEIIFELKEE